MSRKKLIVTCFILLLLLILIAIGIIVFGKKEVKNIGSFYDNQNQVKGNLSEGYYEIVSNDEFKELFEQKIDPHTKPSAISSNFAP